MIQNPVLTGFHADPSMICVEDTFYVANSTFEYFPGVRISASKDLANWECVSAPQHLAEHLNTKFGVKVHLVHREQNIEPVSYTHLRQRYIPGRPLHPFSSRSRK